MDTEERRSRALAEAQTKAAELFALVGPLIRAGETEQTVSDAIDGLARERFGTTTHWHKRIVRSGPNTLLTFDDNPPDRVIEADDIVFIDLGPVFAEWEADFGRTFVLGDDPAKARIRDDAAAAFAAAKAHFAATPEITGAELYAFLGERASEAGWTFEAPIAGHLVGEFPHKRLPENATDYYATPDHHEPLRGLDSTGRNRHWILEVHFIDRDRRIGAFYEELLTI